MARRSLCHLSKYPVCNTWKYSFKRSRFLNDLCRGFVCPAWLTWMQMHQFCCKIYAWSRNTLLLYKFSQCLLWCSGDISNPAAFLFARFCYHFFFCFFACLLLKAEQVFNILPLTLKVLYLVELAKFEISVYFTTKLPFSGLFSLYTIKNSHRESVNHKELKNISDILTHW